VSRVAVVSGGATGIGRATAEAFVANGDTVVLLGRRREALAKAAQELDDAAGSHVARFAAVDLGRPEAVAAALGEDSDALPETVDVLINNAGGVSRQEGTELDEVAQRFEEDWRNNVLSAVLLTAVVGPRLRRPGASIVTLSSISGLRGGGDSYAAAKAAIIGWNHSTAAQYGPQGITANVVAPGFVPNTEFFGDSLTDERRQVLIGQTLVGRAGEPEDVAAAILYLTSPAASWVTGQVLQVNGGALLGR